MRQKPMLNQPVATPPQFMKRYAAVPLGVAVMGHAKRPAVALCALFGFLGSQWFMPNLCTLQGAVAAEHQAVATERQAAAQRAQAADKRAAAQRPPAWYVQERQREQQRQAAMRAAAHEVATTTPSAKLPGAKSGIRLAQGGARVVQVPVATLKRQRAPRSSQPGRIRPSAPLYVPNRYTTTRALDLSHVPTQRELSGAGGMCGALAPTAPADVLVFAAEMDKRLKAAGITGGLKATLRFTTPAGQMLLAAKARVQRAEKMNLAFGQAAEAWNRHDFKRAVPLLQMYVKAYPTSPWAAEAMIHLADQAKFAGRPNEALAYYKQIIATTSDSPTQMSFEAHQKAKERWADLYIMEGRYAEARPLLEDIMQHDLHWRRRTWASHWRHQIELYRKGRPTGPPHRKRPRLHAQAGPAHRPNTYATYLAHLAALSLQHAHAHPRDAAVVPVANGAGTGRNCGTQALAAVFMGLGKAQAAREIAGLQPTREAGFSLLELQQIAQRHGLAMQGFRARAEQLASLPLPLVLHYGFATTPNKAQAAPSSKGGHFLVAQQIDAKTGVVYLLNPQDDSRYTLTLRQLNQEWSGLGLALAPISPTVYSQSGRNRSDSKTATAVAWLSTAQMQQAQGTCFVVSRPNPLGHPKKPIIICIPCDKRKPHHGAPGVEVDPISQNIFIEDTPIWYTPPIGPAVDVTISYNSQDPSNYNAPFGNKWTFNYGSHIAVNSAGRVTIFMPDGREDIYTPDGSGGYTPDTGIRNTLTSTGTNSWELTFQDGAKFIYGIPAGTTSLDAFLVAVQDRWGYSLNLAYDSNIHLTSIYDAQNKITTLTYDSNGHIIKVMDPFGRLATFSYDGNGNLVEAVDTEGQAFQYTYDNMVNVTQLNTAQGPWTFNFQDSGPPGSLAHRYMTTTIYNPLQNSAEQVRYDGAATGQAYYYIDHRGNTTQYYVTPITTHYDYSGYENYTISGTTEISGITHPNGDSEWMNYDTNTDLLTSSEDTYGLYTQWSYNSQGMPTSQQVSRYYGGGGTPQTTSYSYAANGLDLTGVVDANQNTVFSATYDTHHQPLSMTDGLNNTSYYTYTAWGAPATAEDAATHTLTYNYDGTTYRLASLSQGNVTLASYSYDNIGRVHTFTDAANLTLTYAYNNLDHVTKVTYPDGTHTDTEYVCCALPGMIRDRAGRKTYYDYDPLKQLKRVQDAAGNSASYDYDLDGNLLRLSDTNHNFTHCAYDGLNRVTRKTYADGTYDAYAYSSGLLSSHRNPRGLVTNYNYDDFERLQQISYPNLPAVSYNYDADNQMTQMTDGIGTTTYSRDVIGRVTIASGPFASDAVTHHYDNLGRRDWLKINGAAQTIYGYDTLSRLNTLTSPAGTWNYSYAGNTDLVNTLMRPNGTMTNYSHDNLERLTSVDNLTSANQNISHYGYGYDAVNLPQRGVRTWMESQVGSNALQHTDYSYDTVNQLTGEVSTETPTPHNNKGYSYDAMGNRTQVLTNDLTGSSQVNYSRNKLNQITNLASTVNGMTTTANLGYDANGNTITYGNATLSYDDADRLSQIVTVDPQTGLNQHKSVFLYDGFSRKRVAQEYYWNTQNNAWTLLNETHYIYDGMDVVQERDGNNNIAATYTRVGNVSGILARTLPDPNGGATSQYYYHYDGHGNVAQLTDANQNTVASYSYDAYGNTSVSEVAGFTQPYRYQTKEYHSASGFYDYGLRFYSPGLGRFINRDPIKERGGVNLYGFVANNPVKYTDRRGLQLPAVESDPWDDRLDVEPPMGGTGTAESNNEDEPEDELIKVPNGFIIRRVNPGYPGPGRTMNCVNCAAAADATLAGRPSSALPSDFAKSPDDLNFLDASGQGWREGLNTQQDIENILLSQGNGARGIVFGNRGPGNVGHVWNAININGQVYFWDAQAGCEASSVGYQDFDFLLTSKGH